MARGRKTAALAALGLGAAALSGLFDKKKDKKDDDKPITKEEFLKMEAEDLAKERRTKADTTADASAGMAKDRLADMKTPIRKAPARKAATKSTPAASTAAPVEDRTSSYDKRVTSGSRNPRRYTGTSGMGNDGEGTGTFSVGELNPRMTRERLAMRAENPYGLKKGGMVKKSAPKASSASKRADGCAIKGKTRGRMV